MRRGINEPTESTYVKIDMIESGDLVFSLLREIGEQVLLPLVGGDALPSESADVVVDIRQEYI